MLFFSYSSSSCDLICLLLQYCWKTACDVFILERQITVDQATIISLDQKIDTLVGHMQTLQTVFPLTGLFRSTVAHV